MNSTNPLHPAAKRPGIYLSKKLDTCSQSKANKDCQ